MGLHVCLCVQQSFVVTLELQSVVSEREEVSSTNQKCPSAVLHLSFWSAQRPDFVKVMVPGVAHSHAVSVCLIIYVHLMTRENREAIIKMLNIIHASFNSIGHAISISQRLIKSFRPYIFLLLRALFKMLANRNQLEIHLIVISCEHSILAGGTYVENDFASLWIDG